MTSLLLVVCLAAHAFVLPPTSTNVRRRRATQTHAIRNWWSGASSERDWRSALREACAGVAAALSEADDDDAVLALCFASRGHAQYIESIGEAFDEEVGDRATSVALIGGGVVGGAGDEREDGATNEQRQTDNSEAAPALSVLVGVLPKGSSVSTAAFAPDKTPPPKNKAERWRSLLGDAPRACLVFADPSARWLGRSCGALDAHFPDCVVGGGLTCATGGASTITLGGALLPAGATCVLALSGPRLRVDCVASQGCAPVGDVYEVTRTARSQVVAEIDGRPPAVTLDAVMRGATDRERELLKRGALVGLRPSAASRLSGGGSYSKDGDEEAADWLVRQIIGQVPSVREQMSWSNRMSGIQYTARRVSDAGLAVDAEVRAGDEVRFHVRDATAAKNDLDLQLRRYALERAYSSAASSIEACLVIPCVGRGRLLFGESGSDTRTIGAALGGQAAVGGFFANGELGPVGAVVGSAAAPVYRRRTHQHDYAVVAVVFGGAGPDGE
jgi:small ligand-binding sensory domain FIST